MTQEIKFRAILNQEARINGRYGHTNHVREFTLEDIVRGKLAFAYPEHWQFVRYTGLLDRNGKEIYEGDILRSKENDEVYRVDDIIPLHRHTHVTNIGYFSGKKYELRENPAGQYDNQDDWMSWPEMYEIIGNIYENRDLIK